MPIVRLEVATLQGCFPACHALGWGQVFNSFLWNIRDGDILHVHAKVDNELDMIPPYCLPFLWRLQRTLRSQSTKKKAQIGNNLHPQSTWRTVLTDQEHLHRYIREITSIESSHGHFGATFLMLDCNPIYYNALLVNWFSNSLNALEMLVMFEYTHLLK